ncbi:hypothetical protein [Desulfobulbus sp.]|uniref:hypothetical protein n=1 Tax=Desulfobulbus sp. TaxID=895 RepID=UPI0027BA2A49|nr:hypothetical protein [Desulfobulbus sp.]
MNLELGVCSVGAHGVFFWAHALRPYANAKHLLFSLGKHLFGKRDFSSLSSSPQKQGRGKEKPFPLCTDGCLEREKR